MVGNMPKRHGHRATGAERITNLWTLLVSGLIVVAGLSALWLVTAVTWFEHHSTTKVLAEQLAGLLITTGGLALLWDLRGKREIMQEVFAKVGLGGDVASSGLQRASMDWRTVPWRELIAGAKEIDVFVAYGSTWLSTHSTELTEFAKNRRHKLRFILPDPDDSVAMAVLAARFDYTPEVIRAKVEEAARTVAKISRDGNADIRVWYRPGAPTYTCYRFDGRVVVTLYQHKVGRGAVPTLVTEQGSFTDFFVGDLEAIMKQSREIGRDQLIGGVHA